MKKLYVLLGLLSLLGCGTVDQTPNQTPDQKWLEAAQGMIKSGDMVVSTTNVNRVKMFTDWAVSNKYIVVISDTDSVAGKRSGMYFIVVTDVNKK